MIFLFLPCSFLKDSNPQPFAPLGSAPAPRAPRVLPPLSATLPLTPPARCAQRLLLGVEMWRLDVALHGSVVAASLPRTSCKKRAFPPMSGGAASAGDVFLPCMRHRRSACATSRGEAPRIECRVLHRAGQRAALWRCTVRLHQRPR
jgi:hypothetical protein